MTRLSKPVTRELSPATARDRALVVTLAPEGLRFREKGRRHSWVLPYSRAVLLAARLEADARVAERRAQRRVRKGGAR